MTMLRPQSVFPLAITALGLGLLGLFFVYPLFTVFKVSFIDAQAHITLANYAKILSKGFYQQAFINSFAIGIASTIGTTLLGVPLAYCVARLPVPGKSAVLVLIALPLVLPSFIAAYALVLLLGRSGVMTVWLQAQGIPFRSIYGMPGLVAVYMLTLYPYVVLPTLAAFKAVDASMEEAGQNLGASRWRVFWTVVLPIVAPSVMSGALLVLIESLENFGVAFVLAEDRPILSIEVYRLFAGEVGSNPASAGVLGVSLILCTTSVLLLQRRYLSKRRFATSTRAAPPIHKVGSALNLLATVFVWGTVLVALVPFFAVLVISFLEFRGPVMHGNFSVANFQDLWNRSSRPLFNTVFLASAASLVAALVGVPIGYVVTRFRSRLSHLLDMTAMMPFAVSGTVLGIGLVVAFNAGWLILTGGWLILVIAYCVRKLPFNVRASSAILHQIDPSLEEASINLGFSPVATFFRLTVPLMLGGVVGGMVLTWVTLAAELSSTVVLYSGSWSTMTTVIFQALEGTGAGIASAASAVLILTTALPLLMVYRLLRKHQLAVL
ncbi:MAG: iron ABC transporter permease [Alphaproteobacteria bacterium]|nr:iron ABC transporter permease [Alphaproteobacteria bacterium]